ncbi:MAG TPA: hypothetical protein VLA16_27165 [Ideonella sp.]|nr:hypothetical protein [Ideonella sp.]
MLHLSSCLPLSLPRGRPRSPLWASLPAAASFALAACDTLPPQAVAAAPVVREVKVPVEVRVEVPVPTVLPADAAGRQLLVWQDGLRAMNTDALNQELARLSDALPNGAAATAPVQAMHLALALGLSRNAGDLSRGIGLLDQVQRNTSAEAQAWYGWARLLSSRYQEQRRLEEQVERQAQQLRDGQKQRDQLNEKLDALRAIERSLTRPPSAGSK